jgi:hypothetical protein
MYSGSFRSGDVGLFVSLVPINLPLVLIITRVARFFNCSWFVLYCINSIMRHRAHSVFATPGM